MSTQTSTIAINRITARDMALIAVFAALTAALGLIPAFPVPLSPVPITAQSLGVILAGAILGPYRGALSQVLFLVLVAVGLPLLAGGRGGIGVFAGPTIGYLVGFVVCAFVVGWLTYRIGAPYKLHWGLIINIGIALTLMYALGTIGLLLRTKLTLKAAIVSNTPFIIGDTLKSVVAAIIAAGVHSAMPGMLPHRDKKNTK